MGTNRPQTIKEVLQEVYNLLGSAKPRMSDFDTVGVPVARAMAGIKLCVDTLEKAEHEQAKQNAESGEEDDDFNLELVEDGEAEGPGPEEPEPVE